MRKGFVYKITALALIMVFSVEAKGLEQAGQPAQGLASFAEFAGFEVSERIAETHRIVSWLEYLEARSERVRLVELGHSFNKERQVAAIVTAPSNHARLDEIQQRARLLADPRGLEEGLATEILAEQPALVYLGGSIHGFELSGTEGLLLLLGTLVNSSDAEVMHILEETVILIDPVINADGRDAFARFNHSRLGRTISADRVDWSNDFTAWDALTYRTSHYFFDLNRDWFAHTHPETRNRAALLQQWPVQAGVDAHEMGPDTEFYVDPPTDPVSPFFPEFASRWFEEYGRAHATAFDRHGVEYTKREIFNFFYPAYFTSYMSYQGAVGMLYEQGSTRGLALERSDGSVRTLEQAATQQYIAFKAMLGLTADRRQELLVDYLQASRKAVAADNQLPARYILEPQGDPALLAEAVNMLQRNGIEVAQLEQDTPLRRVYNRTGTPADRHTVAAGSYVIESAQPRRALIHALLESEVPVPDAFLQVARARVDRGENPRFYDITSYSLPLLFNLTAWSTLDSRSLDTRPVDHEVSAATAGLLTGATAGPVRRASYAYVFDGSQARALSVIPELTEAGERVSVLFRDTRIEGRPITSGSVVVRVTPGNQQIHGLISELAQRFDLRVDAYDSGRADAGYPPLGSVEGRSIRHARIAVVGDHPVNAYSFGWIWHKLDRQYEIPHIVINARTIGSVPLERFDVLIVPEIRGAGEMARLLGESGMERIGRWVRDGGTLVAVGSGADFVRSHLELSSLQSWYDHEDHSELQRVSVPGAFFDGAFDNEHWITSGYQTHPPLMVNSSRVLVPKNETPAALRNAAVRYGNEVVSGHAWQENRERVPGGVFAWDERVGRGRVVLFAEDTGLRGYWRGVDRLFLNAVLLGPSAP